MKPPIELHEFLKEHSVNTIEMAMVDLTGALRGKRVPVEAFFESGIHGKVGFSSVLFAWDYAANVLPDDRINWASGYPDIFAQPDLTTLRLAPWRPGSAVVFCDAYDATGEPVSFSPRQILKRAVAASTSAHLEIKVGLEAEFYILDPTTRLPTGHRNPVYSLHDDSHLEPMLEQIRECLATAGVAVEACGAEYAPGQVEINLRYRDALGAADDHIFFRYAVKQVAARNGWLASFMAKPFQQLSGSGLHVHQSLWRDGVNVFWDGSTCGLSELGRRYMAGLLEHARETYAVTVPTPNGYKRKSGHSFAPTTVSWGRDNRCTALRALERGPSGTRIESRIAAADANPYLVVACGLASGLSGLRNGLSPIPEAVGDVYNAVDDVALPSTPAEAVGLLRASSFAREVLGPEAAALLASLSEQESILFLAQVTEWERNRYLEAV